MPHVVQACRSCKAKIIWITMQKSGKSNPIDAEPVPNGNIAIGGDGLGYVVTGDNRTPPLYRSHFASCVNAAHHRKDKK